MGKIDRRQFLCRATGAAAGALAVPAVHAGEGDLGTGLTASTVRTLGNTGIQLSMMGMGTGVNGWNGTSKLTRMGKKHTFSVFERAYGNGITFFDLADMYGSHPYMREMLTHTIGRDRVTILSKVTSREADFVKADLERFRRELDTDCIDIVLMHCLTDRDGPNWPEKLKPAMDVLDEAKSKGIIRAHGVSCHSLACLKEAAASEWVDVILARINPFGVKMDGTPEEVAPVLQQAKAAGKGVLGMKIVGEGQLKDKIPESMRYALSLGCIDAMTIGFLQPDEIDGAMAHLKAAAKA